ncbi:unnamed protein product [Paramecium primaurelia]|uniref:Uncharacterized protein n=1 Tax=Paramecium primaurelia TaxID=5886 RepID=A0A8S1L5M1_PARPR|nr:unnamed protein product [Paramecium primaurelia]
MISNTISINSSFKCNIYYHSPLQCIQSTSLVKCKYEIQENICLETEQRNLGCSSNLNEEACIFQLTDQWGNDVNCIFLQRCQTINQVQLQKFNCSDKLNKLACMNLQQKECVWVNKCLNINEDSKIKTSSECQIYNLPVTPYTCQQFQYGLCMSNGKDGDFRCVEVRLDQLQSISCNQQGLNEKACIAIKTLDQKCIFENKRCQSIESFQIISCDQKLNINACLFSKQLSRQKCEWFESSCRIFQEQNYKCITKKIVNSFVCQNSQGLCMYDEKQKSCQIIQQNKINQLHCNTIGLSREGCLQIKNENCSFYGGICQELNEQDLKSYLCNMDLNEKACINLETEFQYCQWNGIKCERIFINQDIDCPMNFVNKSIKVNGNVCQAISKPDILCKYNQKTNLCVSSLINDECNTSFINLLGCLSIQNNKQACQWIQNQCKQIKIDIIKTTTCENLGYANPYACSQVYQNDSIGCFYDKISQKCKSINVDLNHNSIKIFLNTITCKDQSLGINKVLCASITTELTPCRWHQQQCIYINQKGDIANVPCIHLQYANYQTCSLVQYNNEPCLFFENAKGCINQIDSQTNCETKGLNYIGCQLINKNCYFDKIMCIIKQDIDFIIENNDNDTKVNDYQIIQFNYNNNLKCNSRYLTKITCSQIITIGEKCIWSFNLNSCIEASIKSNDNCLAYSGTNIIINPNVCASIRMDIPEFCAFDAIKKNCKIQYYNCTTKCCTEYYMIGINAHSCSRYSSKEEGIYCYFHDSRCQELKADIVDISNQDLVKQYYNDLKLPCTSMNINSCHMINWSTSQLCYYNGQTCNNLNQQFFPNLKIFTEYPSKLNEFACLAIEATLSSQNQMKYFSYNSQTQRCKELILDSEYPFLNCEDAIGNKNLCTRYTGNKFCKWDPETLKCVTMTLDEIAEIQYCNSNLNIKTCVENKILNCYFSYENDKCVQASEDIDCDQFNQKGKVSYSVCKYINKSGQKCVYSEDLKICIKSEKEYEDVNCNCDISISSGNNRVCYNSTCGYCRWDSNNFICYQNETDTTELLCNDNLNKILCQLVKKEACIWNDIEYQCQVFTPKTSEQFEILNINASYPYNEKVCLLISEAGYYFDRELKKCIKLSDNTNQLRCDQFQMNQYACLYLTRGHYCFYDSNEQIPNNFCKFFEDEQSICNTSNLINIEVCMNLPVSCLFNGSTLQCESFQVQQTHTYWQLFDYSKNKKHHNKIACASVGSAQTEFLNENLCTQQEGKFQQCNFEKYGFWKEYTCQVYQFLFQNVDCGIQQNQQDLICQNMENQNDCPDQDLLEILPEYEKFDPEINISIEWSSINLTCRKQKINYYSEQSFIIEIKYFPKFMISITKLQKFYIISLGLKEFNFLIFQQKDSKSQNQMRKNEQQVIGLLETHFFEGYINPIRYLQRIYLQGKINQKIDTGAKKLCYSFKENRILVYYYQFQREYLKRLYYEQMYELTLDNRIYLMDQFVLRNPEIINKREQLQNQIELLKQN